MARPRKEGMNYFPHDVDARNDRKVKMLRTLYGAEGYMFYFVMLENIYNENNFQLDVSDAEIRAEMFQLYAKDMEVTVEKFETMLNTAIKWGCFDRQLYEEKGIITSNGIQKRAAVVLEKRQKERDRYKQKVSATETGTETPPEKPQRKEKKRKEKHNNYTPEFETFWTHYPRKTEKLGAFEKWKIQVRAGYKPEILIAAAINYAKECKKNETEERYIKHAKTFLGPKLPFTEYLKQGKELSSAEKIAKEDRELEEARRKRLEGAGIEYPVQPGS